MEEVRTIILALMLIISNGVTILLYLKNKKATEELYLQNKQKEKIKDLHDKLFQIQSISINNPYLEDKKFIDTWIDFKKKYHNNYEKLTKNEKDIYLRYEQYCEMIFNLISNAYNINCLHDEIEFKSWARSHREWWESPLEEHTNRDTYGNELSDIIDKWIK
ncbi:MAG: hypothetical protein DRG78_02295 [Epsilonproteobacteria bacterium]|nr:MAG: hypothetical protein DRG78_02295 [Campylobacterota bacterium]